MASIIRRWVLVSVLLAAALLSGCAASFNSRGLNWVAEANYTQVVDEFEPRDGQYAALPFQDLIYLCSAYGELKNYSRLFPCLTAAQAKIDGGDFMADAWNHSATPSRLKAIALIELGQYEEAVRAAGQAQKIVADLQLTRFEEVKVLEVLGMAYALAGKTDQAIAAADALKGLYLGYPYMLVADDRNIGLAKIYLLLKKYQDAINVVSYKFEDSNSFLKSFAGWDVFVNNKLSFEFMKNKSLLEVGRVSEARPGYDALLAYPHIQDRGEMYWILLYDRGRMAEMDGRIWEAVGFYEKAVEVIEKHRSTINVEASKIGFVGDKQAVYHNLIRALYADRQYTRAFEYVERSKSRALVDLLAGKRDFAVKTTENAREALSSLALQEKSEEEILAQDFKTDKSRSRSIAVKAREDLRRDAPELASLVSVAATPAADIQSLLTRQEILVEYYYSGDDMYAFILSASGLQSVRLQTAGLSAEVAAFRTALENPRSRNMQASAGRLYVRLIKPLEDAIAGRDLVIVPHGLLHYIPFNALHDGRYFLIDRFRIRMMPSSSVMRYLADKKSAAPGGILAFGNPDLRNPEHDLAFAQKEALDVAKIWPGSKVYVRRAATEEAFYQNALGFNIIHFATHGRFSPEAPLQSALLLAPDARSSGLLTVDKLYSIQIGASLVTLSACETGLSLVAQGDDLVGLTRGFLYAGARSVVASLWKVDDLATAHLMMKFYRGLQKTDKLEALRDAQLDTRKKYSHPYFWASFQLTGSAK